jgi:PhzF family phenazine biosynthesis protein
MRIPIFQVDAFATRLFSGNPAAVMPLDRFPADAVLQKIAAENNLAETAFFAREGDGYRLRWFTPTTEVPLCGHATLASAAVIMERLERSRREVTFETASGKLMVKRRLGGYVMDFPARTPVRLSASEPLGEALAIKPVELFGDAAAYLAVLRSPQEVRDLAPDMTKLAALDRATVIVTAPGDTPYDFTSRFFAPGRGIPEDPVTGSAHCLLVPFWAERFGRSDLYAHQASARGGEILCRLVGDRIELEGSCVFYLEGEVLVPDAD